jgi:hypothetical protein
MALSKKMKAAVSTPASEVEEGRNNAAVGKEQGRNGMCARADDAWRIHKHKGVQGHRGVQEQVRQRCLHYRYCCWARRLQKNNCCRSCRRS